MLGGFVEPVIITHIQRHGNGWDVTVEVGENSDSSTTHNVSVDDDYYEYLTAGDINVEELVEQSFEFLLSREPKESIMRNFDLDLIGKYIDDYEETIKLKVQGS